MATKAEIGCEVPEGRRWRRYHLTVPVRVTTEKSRVSVINSLQVNAGGLAFFADIDLAIGDEAEIEFADYHITLRGVVRNRSGNLYGMEFLATSATEKGQLSLFRQILRTKVGRICA